METALQKQLEDLVKKDSAQIGITATNADDVKITAVVDKTLGNGWSVSAAANWARKKGYEIGAFFGWTSK